MRLNTNELFKAVRLALTAGAAVGVIATPAIAVAQDQDAETLETITVVGSRIKRTDVETSQPVFVIEREDLAKTGLSSVGDILQQLATNGATLNTTFNNGGNGETRVDLRNLGSNRTLVLVNGRRWVPTIDGAVDLNTIPLSIIERVEVLKDGASAIYGSDAIAGVINITTRDTYDGAEATAFISENEEGDGRQQAYDFTIGSSTDRASALVNVSYVKQEPIFAGDRDISAVPSFGIPANNVLAGASSTTRFGRFDGPGIPGTIVLDFNQPGCATGVVCAPSTRTQFVTFNPNIHGFNFAPENYLVTPQERIALYAQARYNVTDTITFRTEVLYNERRSSQFLAPMPLTVGTALFGPGTPSSIDIPASNIYNPFGITINRAQIRMPAANPRIFAQNVDTYRFGGGFDGTFDIGDRSFSWDTSYTYSDNELLDTTDGLLNLGRVAEALGPNFIAADGTPTCGTPAAPIDGCVPLNVFGGAGQITQEMFDYISFLEKNTAYQELHNYTANVTGDLFELPAGPLSFAAGYEYRRNFAQDSPDALTVSGLSTGNAATPTSGGFSLDEFYAEFNVPLLKDVAFAEILEINMAARYSDYSNFGDTTNPKIGFRWKPFSDLLVRGNYSEGFRAPSVFELFQGESDSFPQLFDPCSISFVSSDETLARCIAAGVPYTFTSPTAPQNLANLTGGYDQANLQIRITVGGDPNLVPENARTKTLGLVYSPSFLEGLNFYLDWYNIEIVNALSQPSGGSIANACFIPQPAVSDAERQAACDLITRLPGGEISDLLATQRNLVGGTEVEGWDFTVDYLWDTSYGRFKTQWDNAYISYYGSVGQIPGENVVGLYFDRFPLWRLRSNISLNWAYGDWGATLLGRYYSGLDESCDLPNTVADTLGDDSIRDLCDNPLEVNDPQFGSAGINNLGSTTYWDLQGTWDAPWNARIAVGVNNLFDRNPPTAYDTFANTFDPQYEVPGRFWYVQYNQKF